MEVLCSFRGSAIWELRCYGKRTSTIFLIFTQPIFWIKKGVFGGNWWNRKLGVVDRGGF